MVSQLATLQSILVMKDMRLWGVTLEHVRLTQLGIKLLRRAFVSYDTLHSGEHPSFYLKVRYLLEVGVDITITNSRVTFYSSNHGHLRYSYA